MVYAPPLLAQYQKNTPGNPLCVQKDNNYGPTTEAREFLASIFARLAAQGRLVVAFFRVVEFGPSGLRVDQAVVTGLPSSDNVGETGACKLKCAHSDDDHQG